MELITPEQRATLLANGQAAAAAIANDGRTADPRPVVKLFTPDGSATWLLTEIDPTEPEFAYGLCDLGMGSPELGSVSLTEIAALRGKLGLPVERDLYFEASKPISEYAREASLAGHIRA